ncbi:MAG TPA: hypothetical protein VLH84_01750 [Patescibacteria group bacterium]|nr:hypothetical protein [Patescibacteria group bacterium]
MIGPYGGCLPRVTVDYFSYRFGIRGSHNAVFDGMDPQLQADMQPWLGDYVPLPALPDRPRRLLGELRRATLGAWGDAYIGGIATGDVRLSRAERRADRAVRSERAVCSTLTMAMLGAAETALRDPNGERGRTPESVAGFNDRLSRALLGDLQPAQDDSVAVRLAAFMHGRFELDTNLPLASAMGRDLGTIAHYNAIQFGEARNDPDIMVGVAERYGRITASLALNQVVFGQPGLERHVDRRARTACEELGRLGGILRHGTNVPYALEQHLPTYATAILVQHGGPSDEALRTIQETRDDQAHDAISTGREFLRGGSRKQRGTYAMAVRLLDIKEGRMPDSGSREQIEALLQDPYWSEAPTTPPAAAAV